MPDRPWTDEYTLLCEKCGYIIEGLDTQGHCPECGKPIAESLPERRVGTPWQQSPGVKSLLATWWMTLRHPLRTLDVMQLTERPANGIGSRTLFFGSGCMYLFITVLELVNPYSLVDFFAMFITSGVGALFAVAGFLILSEVELAGLRVISKSRGFRVTEPIAYNIVSHGCVGWIVCGVFMALSLYCVGQSMFPSEEMFSIPWSSGESISGYELADYYSNLSILFFVLSIPGFLFFETFAYLGLRRLKYANRVRPANLDEPRP